MAKKSKKIPENIKKIKSVKEVKQTIHEIKPRVKEIKASSDNTEELTKEEQEIEDLAGFISSGGEGATAPIIRPSPQQAEGIATAIREESQDRSVLTEKKEELSGRMIYEIGASLGGNSPRYTTSAITSEGATIRALRSSEIGDFKMRERTQVLPEDQMTGATELRKQDIAREENNYEITDPGSKKRRAAWEGQ